MKFRFWMQACGAGFFLMFGLLWPHITSHSDLYHRLLPVNRMFWAIAIDLAVVCLLSAGVFWLLDGLGGGNGRNLASLCWAGFAAVFLYRIQVYAIWLSYLSPGLFKPRYTLVVAVILAVSLWYWRNAFFLKLITGLRWTLVLLSFCLVWVVPELLYVAIRPEPREKSGFNRPVSGKPLPERRIIWILFDELSQDQIFDHRQLGVNLPAFDRLSAESSVFTNLQPAGYYTELVVPSLLWGKTMLKNSVSITGELAAKTAGGWSTSFPAESIFADAHAAGWSTGVAGWYNPYCRTYGAWLDRCNWLLASVPGTDYSSRESVLWNVFAPTRDLAGRFGLAADPSVIDAAGHASDYRQIMDWSQQLIQDEHIQFVFLHLPIPHPPYIYNRRTRRFGTGGSYLDNLVLADTALSQLLDWIGQTRSAGSTALVVCSDHSWRTALWNKEKVWTGEDQRASEGRFDPRPVLIVHLPGQTQGETLNQKFPEIREHDLVEELLKTPLTPDQVSAWSHTQPATGVVTAAAR